MAFSSSMLLPLLVSLYYKDGEHWFFLLTASAMFILGLVLWLPLRSKTVNLRRRDGFLLVVIFWLIVSLLGCLPFLMGLKLSFVNAFFESVSGLTTTGATIMSGLDSLPKSILFFRQQLQWLGGMGLIVLAVAVFPRLGIGGMSIYLAEAPGPMKDEKITPRLAHSARALWGIYVGLTAACALAFWVVGMPPFEAIAHSLSTVSTGGFSTHDASLGFFDSEPVETVAIVFMLLGALNFSIHYLVISKRRPSLYLTDSEVRSFLVFVIAIVLVISFTLYIWGTYHSFLHALRNAAFEVVSVVTSTGFGVVDFSHWPLFVPVLLIFISFVGGCGGSTAGGMKVMRILILAKLGLREVKRLPHPQQLKPVKVNGNVVPETTLQAVWGFLSVYTATFVVLMLLLMMTGSDQVTAFSAIATSMNNLGPGLGEVSLSFAGLSDSGKMISAIAMLAGRLEIFTLLVILHPSFWKS
jgi:trk system potassium uptake protein TrkH